MRHALMAVWLLLCPPALAYTQVSVGVSIPGLSIGINLPAYPELVVVPGYPVYYAPQLDQNYFFYDGMYWVYADDNWYASYWYNGPWDVVEPELVPVFILRIPVYYYRRPPVYFHAWQPSAPPHWGERWGHDWDRRHRDWDRWTPGEGPTPAPLPRYQRQYTGDHYPHPEEQHVLQQRYYNYRPHDSVVQSQYQRQQQRQNPRGEMRQEERRVMPYGDGVPPPATQRYNLPSSPGRGTLVGPRPVAPQRQREDAPVTVPAGPLPGVRVQQAPGREVVPPARKAHAKSEKSRDKEGPRDGQPSGERRQGNEHERDERSFY